MALVNGLDRVVSMLEIVEGLKMNGKILVVGIVAFFLLFFVYESWLMRGLPH
ncbi:hypothetical protein KR100_08320 [Synechococcus sp. KORDI-100]|uniref:hypothetical protein n=1 Tax=Synechococcus sp. KORDI-100 TaxID=1280380 RepID=UPI0004E093AF|nr:hypothetical protein [Synechococcus sp. KORDI-100]AII43364.1 hypothetical protein KR100_08320 [Synechococcus sp. KORDI-100]